MKNALVLFALALLVFPELTCIIAVPAKFLETGNQPDAITQKSDQNRNSQIMRETTLKEAAVHEDGRVLEQLHDYATDPNHHA